MKKVFMLLAVAVMIICAFLTGIVIGPNLGSTEYEFGEVEVEDVITGPEAAEIYFQNHDGK